MAKVDLEIVKRVLKRAELENDILTEILGELQSVINENTDTMEERPAPIKKQFVIIAADNEGILTDKELVGWVFQISEEEPMTSTPEKLMRTAKAFNLSKKGRRYPVKTVGETCENVPARIFKEQKLWLKTKEPVLIMPVQNALDLDVVNLKDKQNLELEDEDF